MTPTVTIKLGVIPERPQRRKVQETGPIEPFRAEVEDVGPRRNPFGGPAEQEQTVSGSDGRPY